ncbi:PEP/pyruvate-binding domain-containing protein [Streptomyces sp. BPTC-684]|uniref:PEP/pyruvate-binding domain-containing protein n=1 Tax=Streptomyces sp. BPTC-684 TaxID=3043734 RepID=UPI0024B09FE8|nr:PEP/pyruvate-binding domain-containing protein [Streptomyces sp. BPTC-684]WHM40574.1 PEP/pyruvate-binding domain-containing protein [Streptomyces sp. BPTC-684]
MEETGDETGVHADAAVALDRPAARLPLSAGSKAANLARAAAAGLPVLPGFVIPHGAGDDARALRHAWRELSQDGAVPLVVRSSSPQEDTEESSLAGQFASVLDVRDWPAFRAAVRTVLDSADLPDGTRAPMAVLVQPMLTARVGGVLFGADPVEGRLDRMLVSAVRGGPDTLVSGEQDGTSYHLTRSGRRLRSTTPHTTGEHLLKRTELYRLARLARRVEKVFGGPQDMEFGFDGTGRLWLFQARPITAMTARPARGARLLGPGPVAETLPGTLQPLEEDLWVAPMARGIRSALDIGGSAPRRLLRAHPVVTTVAGRAAADLRLLGIAPPRHRLLARINPLPGARRLAAAWRTGRLTRALPDLALDLTADIDRRLAETPAPAELSRADLADLLRWTRSALAALHAQEALAGALLRESSTRTAASAALAALAEGRGQALTDTEIVAGAPVVLALTPPSLTGPLRLPPTGEGQTRTGTAADPRHLALPTRESLRLRIRWIHQLQVHLVHDAARRIALSHRAVAQLRWHELLGALDGEALPADVAQRLPRPDSPPLPDTFRLADDSLVVAERPRHGAAPAQGVSGGRATGTAWDGRGERPEDAVLVVRTLDPALAPLLPQVTALVAQTGSPLSHLAVLAREFRVPAVVGAADAVQRFAPGTRLAVDGTSGDVRLEDTRTREAADR